jgi:nucleoside-diphosphate-sugar epimerase
LGGGGNQEVLAHPDWAIETYVLASQEICRLAKKYSVGHLLLASSVAAHGPRAPYGFLKLIQEQILAESFVPYTIMRFPNMFGVSVNHPVSENGLLGQFISSAVAGRVLKINGDGNQKIDYLHLSDSTAAIKLLLSISPKNETYDVGTEQLQTVNQIARHIIRETSSLSRKRIQLVHVPMSAESGYARISSRALRALGWRPKISFSAGLREVIQRYVQEN